ncbi:MAG: ATPase [Methanosphaera sp. SHI613]|nr:MAG: ATPase [Methanosphaera sp. SHI613]
MIKRQLYLKQLRQLQDKDFIKVITGIRRSGKTTLLLTFIEELKKEIQEENIIYISLEDLKYINITTNNQLYDIIKDETKNLEGKIYFFFDEIQQIENWEKLINGLRVSYDCDIYITGSNSKLLSGELATLIAGRYIEIHVYPFSFNEIIQYNSEIKNINITKEIEEELFEEYITYGGMPGVVSIDNPEVKIQALEDIYNSIILKDIIYRHSISKVTILQRLLYYMIDTVGNAFSSRSIHGYFKNKAIKTSKDTINKYAEYISESFFMLMAKQFYVEGRQVLTMYEKYYLTDHGFHQAIVGNNSEIITGILENIVYIELRRRGYNVKVGKISKEDNKEIDFVCQKNGEYLYIQVTYLLSSEKTINREFGSLMKIKDNYPKYVISTDKINFSRNGIKHINIIDFLKDENI